MFTFTVPQYTLTYKFQKLNNTQIKKKLIYARLNKKKKLRMNIRSVSKHFTSTLANRFNTSRLRGVLILRDLSRQPSGRSISTPRFS